MSNNEQQYLDLCRHVLKEGIRKDDRTGTGTISVFGCQMRFDLQEGFPLLTTKRVPFRLIVSELLWFLKGDTNLRYLLEHNNHIWDEWGFQKWVESKEYTGPDMTDFGIRSQQDEEFKKLYEEQLAVYQHKVLTDDGFSQKFGDLGNVYGKQWRSWEGADGEVYDQIQYIIDEIKRNPDSRRLLCNAWSASELKNQQLPPCHYAFQFYVSEDKLSCMFNMRSNDVFLGLPFNIASYALLTHLIAHECGLEVGELIYTGADVHIYSNHIEQVEKQLQREPRPLPQVKLNPEVKSVFDFTMEDIELIGYDPHGPIKAPVAV
ncbi:thymidylate synthase [Pseudobacillus badius]|uniref:thymidylate synthase n=1 Tax=Bacillus badius TaxID=1455 RepID=UPI0007B0A51A|nr:thymidylate synthase [Bacillus badius]KZN99032.1 thymidylate synthase [Bacillus badius]OCS83971.1 thymidylate synthase [Bacillus badius]OVE52735.1 thymidylate synthase [Bacillus badius]TDW04753.1 thymidylate synthase [Bacillus badius]